MTPSQKKAIEAPNGNLLVSAGAGSGKTTVLTEHILYLLRNGCCRIDQLLVLTFTTASAADLKEKIYQALVDEPRLVGQLPLLATADIGTFDSYIYRLVNENRIDLGIDANPGVIDSLEAGRIKEEALEQLWEQLYSAKDPLIDRLIANTCFLNEDFLKEMILYFYDKLIYQPQRRTFLRECIARNYNDMAIANYLEDYWQLIQRKIDQVRDLISWARGEVNDDLYLASLDKLEAYLDQLNDSDYDRFSLGRRPNLRVDKEHHDASKCKKISGLICAAFKELKALSRFASKREMLDQLDEVKETIEAINKIILLLDNEVERRKRELNQYEFHDFTQMAFKIFRYRDINKFASKYYQIIVDESQDNNNLNDAFIQMLGRNNVFCVGDVKQSIYRFRNSNPELFSDKYASYKKGDGGEKIDFRENFRSRQEVTSFINELFNLIMDANIGGANYKVDHQLISANSIYPAQFDQAYRTEILTYPDEGLTLDKAEREIFMIATEIKHLIDSRFQVTKKDGSTRDIGYGDIAILSAKKRHFRLYQRIFSYLGLPLSSSQEASTLASPEIHALMAALRLVACYRDRQYYQVNFRHSFYAFARSYLFDFSDQEIIDHLLQETDHFVQVLDPIAKLSRIDMPLEQLTMSLIKAFPFFERSYLVGSLEAIEDKMAYLMEFMASSSQWTLTSFIDHLQQRIDAGDDLELTRTPPLGAICLMSIHASKGLEFPVVFLAHLVERFNNQDLRQSYFYSDKYTLVVPCFQTDPKSIVFELARQRENEQKVGEALRLFYVAQTRAREKLYLLKPSSDSLLATKYKVNDLVRAGYSSYAAILDSVDLSSYESDRLANVAIDRKYKLSREVLEIRLGKAPQVTLREREKVEVPIIPYAGDKSIPTLKELQAIKVGQRYHEAFERADFGTNDHYSFFIANFRKQAVIKDLVDPRYYRELPFVNTATNERGIIDLLIVAADKVLIVDYKLKRIDDEEYHQQLNIYYRYISRKVDKPIFLYLYSIKDDILEEVPILVHSTVS